MSFFRVALAVALTVAIARPVLAEPAAKTPDRQVADQAALLKEQAALLNQMAEAQKWQSEELWHVKEQLEAVPGLIAEAKEGHTATQEEVGKLREEVKGLYVELSSVKQQIEDVKEDVAGVNTNVSGFRTYSGFFLALMLLMVAVVFAMSIRR